MLSRGALVVALLSACLLLLYHWPSRTQLQFQDVIDQAAEDPQLARILELQAYLDVLRKNDEKTQGDFQQVLSGIRDAKAEIDVLTACEEHPTAASNDWFSAEPRVRMIPCPSEGDKYVAVVGMVGGLGDRLKGMVNAYVLALLTGRRMYIEYSQLGDTMNSMQPRDECNWRDPVPPATANSALNWDFVVIDHRGERMNQHDFNGNSASPVWRMTSNMPFADELIYNPQFRGPLVQELIKSHKAGKMFHQALRGLVQPHPEVTKLVEEELGRQDPKGTHFLIGVHIRAGDQKIGARKKREAYRATHPQELRMIPDAALPCFAQEALVAWDELPVEEQDKYPDGPLFYFSADYPSGAKQIMELLQRDGYKTFDASHLAGEVKHLFHGGDQSRTFIDWWLLTKCRKMVITASGYSETAAKWNCVPVSFFVNHPTLKQHNQFTPEKCVHHFIRMRGDGLCVPEADEMPLYEYFYYRYNL